MERSNYVPPIEAPNGGYVCYEIRIRDLDLAKCVHGQCVWVWVICEFVWGDMGTKLVLVQEGDWALVIQIWFEISEK